MPHVPIKACLDDVEEIVTLNNLFYLPIKNFIWNKPEWVTNEVKKGNYYILKDEGKIIAAICPHFDINKNQGAIEAISVSENLHGQGIGKSLVKFTENLCISHGVNILGVESFCEYKLENFYKSCGFTYKEKKVYEGFEYICFEMPIKTIGN